jgi:hypothetical protein
MEEDMTIRHYRDGNGIAITTLQPRAQLVFRVETSLHNFRSAAADPSTAFVAENAPNFAQDDSALV